MSIEDSEGSSDSSSFSSPPPGFHIRDIDGDIRTAHEAAARAMKDALRALDNLEDFVDLRADVRREGERSLPDIDDREFYVKNALRELALVRDRCSNAVRSIVMWSEKPTTTLSTHELGRLAGVSNSTVARWQQTSNEPEPF